MDDSRTDNKTVASILIEENKIDRAQLDKLKVEAAHKNVDIDKLLLEEKLVDDNTYYEARAKLYGVPFVSVITLPFSPEALSFVAKPVAERFNLIPFAYDKEKKILSLAMGNPYDIEAINFVRQKTNLVIKSYQGVPTDINDAVQTQYSIGLVKEIKEAIKETEKKAVVKTFDKESISQVIKEAPSAKIVSTLLEYAVKSRASDIHIEP